MVASDGGPGGLLRKNGERNCSACGACVSALSAMALHSGDSARLDNSAGPDLGPGQAAEARRPSSDLFGRSLRPSEASSPTRRKALITREELEGVTAYQFEFGEHRWRRVLGKAFMSNPPSDYPPNG